MIWIESICLCSSWTIFACFRAIFKWISRICPTQKFIAIENKKPLRFSLCSVGCEDRSPCRDNVFFCGNNHIKRFFAIFFWCIWVVFQELYWRNFMILDILYINTGPNHFKRAMVVMAKGRTKRQNFDPKWSSKELAPFFFRSLAWKLMSFLQPIHFIPLPVPPAVGVWPPTAAMEGRGVSPPLVTQLLGKRLTLSSLFYKKSDDFFKTEDVSKRV